MSELSVTDALAGLAEFETYHAWGTGAAFDPKRMAGGAAVMEALRMGERFHRLFCTVGLAELKGSP